MNKNKYIIEISDLNKKFILKNKNSIEIIRDLNFKLKTNSKVSITGPSGSGKTTLLNIIGLLDNEFDGLYLFNGKNIALFSVGLLVVRLYCLVASSSVVHTLIGPLILAKRKHNYHIVVF